MARRRTFVDNYMMGVVALGIVSSSLLLQQYYMQEEFQQPRGVSTFTQLFYQPIKYDKSTTRFK